MSILLLTEADVRSLLTMPLALKAVEAGLKKVSLDEAQNISRTRCQTDHAMLHVLSASAKGFGAMGLKAYTTTKSQAQFYVHLFDGRSGQLSAILQADYLGQVRTGAASGVATQVLAREDASRVAILGTGKQARTQLEAVCAVRPIRSATAFGPNAERRAKFATEMAEKLQIDVVAVDSAEVAVAEADIVCTASTALRDPIFFGAWLRPGMHLNVVGSNFRGKAEVDEATIRGAQKIVVDSKDQARMEAGDLTPILDEADLLWAEVLELGAILAGRVAGRTSAAEITLFKSLGIGIEDVVVAAEVVKLARERGVGQELDF